MKLWKHVGAGFLTGLAFAAACGQQVRATANELMTALEISFESAGTGLSALNVQDAIAELAIRPGTAGPQGPQGIPGTQGSPGTPAPRMVLQNDRGEIVLEDRPEKCGVRSGRDTGYNSTRNACLRFLTNVEVYYAGDGCTIQSYMIAEPEQFFSPDSLPAMLTPELYFFDGTGTEYVAMDATVRCLKPKSKRVWSVTPQNTIDSACLGFATNTCMKVQEVTLQPVTLPFLYPFGPGTKWVSATD